MRHQLTIAIVTDIHYGPARYSKKGDDAIVLLQGFVRQANELNVDLVVDLGDRISNTDPPTDIKHLRTIAGEFQKLAADHYHLIGNHDVVHMTVPEQERIMGASFQHQSLDRKGWHLVFWNPSCVIHENVGFRLAESDLAWLESDLSGTTLPAVVFTHMPTDTGSMVGNYYFEKKYAGGGQHRNAALAREIIEKSEKVIAVVSGHVHWNQLHFMDGIPHLSLQSLSETFTTHPHPSGAWGLLTLGDTIDLAIHGREPMTFSLPIKQTTHHWLPPMI
ncbi:metallophosphoesterase [bacterium]|nr:metallophosphoesterase [bacterium]